MGGPPALEYRGLVPILPTPFHEDESLDLESLSRLVRFLRKVGVEGMTVLGVLGEADRLSDDERDKVVEGTVKAAGRTPVIVGVTRPGTAETVRQVRRAARLGASAAMVAPIEPSALEFFRTIGQAGLPIILQDHPASTGIQLPVDLILRVLRDVPAVAGIKCEAVPTAPKIRALKVGMKAARTVPVMTGLGALYARFDREAGADGFNTGFAFPEVLRGLLGEDASRLYAKYLPLLVFEQQPGPGIRKEILRQRGLLESNRVRSPGTSVDAATAKTIADLLHEFFPGADHTKPLARL